MGTNIDQLSQLLLEADGLLLLLQRHRDETPIDAIKLLRKKLELILALTDGLDDEVDSVSQQPESTGNYIEQTIEDAPKENPIEDSGAIAIATTIEATETTLEEEAEAIDATAEEEAEANIDEPIDISTEKEAEEEEENEEEDKGEEDIDKTTEISAKETSESGPLRRPLSTVLNLNDKFRFRRELFGNSDAQYVECMDMLSAMSGLDEAQEYLFDDLGWDASNEDVQDFLHLLTKYYS